MNLQGMIVTESRDNQNGLSILTFLRLMAKGFTVKANAPKPKKKEEFDIAAIKQRMREDHRILSTRAWMFIYISEELRSTVL